MINELHFPEEFYKEFETVYFYAQLLEDSRLLISIRVFGNEAEINGISKHVVDFQRKSVAGEAWQMEHAYVPSFVERAQLGEHWYFVRSVGGGYIVEK